ncbi:MAG: hypothetical protein ACKVOR_01185 [Flavobacteriales bacterium]
MKKLTTTLIAVLITLQPSAQIGSGLVSVEAAAYRVNYKGESFFGSKYTERREESRIGLNGWLFKKLKLGVSYGLYSHEQVYEHTGSGISYEGKFIGFNSAWYFDIYKRKLYIDVEAEYKKADLSFPNLDEPSTGSQNGKYWEVEVAGAISYMPCRYFIVSYTPFSISRYSMKERSDQFGYVTYSETGGHLRPFTLNLSVQVCYPLCSMKENNSPE